MNNPNTPNTPDAQVPAIESPESAIAESVRSEVSDVTANEQSEVVKEVTIQQFLKKIGIDFHEFTLVVDPNELNEFDNKFNSRKLYDIAHALIKIGYVDEVLKHIDEFISPQDKQYFLKRITENTDLSIIEHAEEDINKIISWQIKNGFINPKDPRYKKVLERFYSGEKRNPEFFRLATEAKEKKRLLIARFWELPENTTDEELSAIRYGFDVQRKGTRDPNKDEIIEKSASALNSVYERLRSEKIKEGLSEPEIEEIINRTKKRHELRIDILRMEDKMNAGLNIHNTPEEDRKSLERAIINWYKLYPGQDYPQEQKEWNKQKMKADMDLLEEYYGHKE